MLWPAIPQCQLRAVVQKDTPRHTPLPAHIVPRQLRFYSCVCVCVKATASHTGCNFMAACLWQNLYFWEDMSIKSLKLSSYFGSSAALGHRPAALRFYEMLCLAGGSGGTDRSSETSWSRAAAGHTQQAHTREVYMLRQPRGSLYTSCVGGRAAFFCLCTKNKYLLPITEYIYSSNVLTILLLSSTNKSYPFISTTVQIEILYFF